MDRPPHVLILMCDQMQHDRMGCVDGFAHTPTLDRIAREGAWWQETGGRDFAYYESDAFRPNAHNRWPA